MIVIIPNIPVEKFEPFHAVFTGSQPRTYFIFGVSVLIVSCFIKRFWCSFFCIDGALFEIINSGRKARNDNTLRANSLEQDVPKDKESTCHKIVDKNET